jgi:hypothetical protein
MQIASAEQASGFKYVFLATVLYRAASNLHSLTRLMILYTLCVILAVVES